MNSLVHTSLSTSDYFLRQMLCIKSCIKSLCQGYKQFKRSLYVLPESFPELLTIYILIGYSGNSSLTIYHPALLSVIYFFIHLIGKKTIFTLHFFLNFEIIVDSHAVVRKSTMRSHVSFFSVLPNGNILKKYSTPSSLLLI